MTRHRGDESGASNGAVRGRAGTIRGEADLEDWRMPAGMDYRDMTTSRRHHFLDHGKSFAFESRRRGAGDNLYSTSADGTSTPIPEKLKWHFNVYAAR